MLGFLITLRIWIVTEICQNILDINLHILDKFWIAKQTSYKIPQEGHKVP